MNAEISTTTVKPEHDIAYRLLWRMGFDAACEGRSFFDMMTTPERAGYRAALAACAEAETPAQYKESK